MASFEQNQQDQVNMNNTLDQIKQFNAECDKATAAMRAADLEAEEELLGVRLKNLTKAQQAKLTQLNQLLELEEKSIQELAKLRLTLSNRQFAIRKQEIQKEFQLYKAEAENFFRSISKYKVTTPVEAPKKASTAGDIKASTKNKSADAAIQKADKKVKIATYGVDKVGQDITEAISSLQELAEATVTTSNKNRQAIKNQAPTVGSKTKSENNPSTEVKAEAQKEKNFSNDSKGMERADEGKFSFADIMPALDAMRATQEAELAAKKEGKQAVDFSSVIKTLNKLNKKGENGNSQTTLDLAGKLVNQTKEADKSITKLREFNENKTQNMRLIRLAEQQRLNKEYSDKEYQLAEDSAKRKAQLDFIEAHRKELIDQNLEELRSQHADEEVRRRQAHNKELARAIQLREDENDLLANDIKKFADARTKKHNDLTDEARGTKAEYTDIKDNEGDYRDIAREEHENAFYAERNRRLKESFAIEEGIAWDKAHIDEVMAEEVHKKQMGFAKEYGEYQRKAGKYAVDKEKFEKDRARKANTAAKKEAVNGMAEGLKKFGTGEFSMTDVKQAYGEYMGQRTAELNTFDKEEYMADLKATNPDMSDEEATEAAEQKAQEAAASAKVSAQFELLASAAGSLAKALDADVKKISAMQGIVDTRLQGSQTNKRDFGNGSYWNQLLEDAKKIAGASPFIKQETLVDNIKALIDQGISFDIKQRAFLMTIQEKIANTFKVADGTLLRLIRIQQEDTTAGRLGMESALNTFLNQMYETSEYLSEVAEGVRSSLEEMQALMDGAAGTEVEYQVQKWMGSLYSVGMSKSAVDSIAQTFGQIASGDVGGLTGSGAGNLLIMAANEAGMSIADILQEGLDADETNKLMQAMVNYLAEIAETSSDSKVVQQQLANVYGIKASDLRAATNLASSIKDVSKQNLTYGRMLGQLESMMGTIRQRTSIGEGMTNMWDNIMYSMASTQASNPILYALPKMADLLRDVTGGNGITLPAIHVAGFGIDLKTSVADLMSVASMAGTALGTIGPLITGINDLFDDSVGQSMLLRAGISTSDEKAPVLARGSAQPLQHLGGSSISESGYVGQGSGEDIKNQTLQGAEDDKKKQMVEAKDEATEDDVAMQADLAVVNIYNLLEEVAHGSQSLRVRVVNSNGFGAGSGAGGGSTGNPIGEGSSNGSTGAMGGNSVVNGVNGGADNGNWILSF